LQEFLDKRLLFEGGDICREGWVRDIHDREFDAFFRDCVMDAGLFTFLQCHRLEMFLHSGWIALKYSSCSPRLTVVGAGV